MSLVLSRWGDNRVAEATISLVACTAQSGYGADKLGNGSWAWPFWLEETEFDIRLDFGSPYLPEFLVLGNSNIDVAVRVQGHPTNSFAGSTDVDVNFGVPERRDDDYFTSPWLDMRAHAAKRWWRFSASGNALPIAIGELWMGETYTEFDAHLLESADFETVEKTELLETPMGVEMAYPTAPAREKVGGDLIMDADAVEALRAMMRANRHGNRPFFAVVNTGIDDAVMVRFDAGSLKRTPLGGRNWRVTLPLRELSRGETFV